MDLRGKPFYLDDKAVDWVEKTRASMSLEEKVGHLFCVNYRTGDEEEVDMVYSIMKPGGCMYRTIPLEKAIHFTNYAKRHSNVPLLIAANLEKGGNGIVSEGTLLGAPLEVAATDDIDMAKKLGVVCAKEGKAVGANWAFAPIVDIDTNFRNPITNTRTFGSDPERVARMGKAYIEQVQNHGIAACFKHFPGDGQDERDQHLVTSVNDLSCEEWDKTYGKIYETCIDAGAMTCMIGHIMQPAYTKYFNPGIDDNDILPGSMSKEIMIDLLRGKLGFNGLILTDATTMAGYTLPMSRKDAVPLSIANGSDMFLFALNLQEDYEFMLEGVKNGVITPERLDEAVTRILALKAALGLHVSDEEVSLEEAQKVVGCDEHKEWARECADKAITLVKEEKGVLPITPQKYKKVLFHPIEAADGGFSQYRTDSVKGKLIKMLEEKGFDVDEYSPHQGSEGKRPRVSETIDKYDLIIYVANLSTKSNQTIVRIEWAQPMGANCLHYKNDVPTIFISVENPYHLLDVPRARTFINTYNSNDFVLQELVEKLVGNSEFKGINPVDPFCGKWDTHLS